MIISYHNKRKVLAPTYSRSHKDYYHRRWWA